MHIIGALSLEDLIKKNLKLDMMKFISYHKTNEIRANEILSFRCYENAAVEENMMKLVQFDSDKYNSKNYIAQIQSNAVILSIIQEYK